MSDFGETLYYDTLLERQRPYRDNNTHIAKSAS